MKKIAISTLLSALIAAPAFAADVGPYIGLSAGQNEIDVTGVDASIAYSVFGGYSFNEYIAGELAYVDFGSADTADPAVSVKGNAISLSAVGSFPLSTQFSLFAKLGFATTEIKNGTSQTKDDLTYGVGAQYNPTGNIGLRLGYDNYRVGKDTTKDSALVSLAALFKF